MTEQVLLISRFGEWRRTMWLPTPLPQVWLVPRPSEVSVSTVTDEPSLGGPNTPLKFGLTPKSADGLRVYWEGWRNDRWGGRQTIREDAHR